MKNKDDKLTQPPSPSQVSSRGVQVASDIKGVSQVQVSPTAVPAVTTPTRPKRAFTKKTIIATVGILFILILAFVLAKLAPGGNVSGGVELTWWGLWQEKEEVQPLIDEYQAANPGVSITYIKQSPQDYRERLQSALARGEGPDIFRFHNTWVPMFRKELDAMPSSVMSPADYTKTYYPVVVKDMTSGANIVGIPLAYDALTLFINEDIFEGAGKSPPVTWVEFRRLASELTIRGVGGEIVQSGAALGAPENVDYWPEILALMMLQNGVDLTLPASSAAKDALAFFAIFSNSEAVWNKDLPPSTRFFSDGKLAMYFAPSARAAEIVDRSPDLRFRAVPLPQLPKENPDMPDTSYASYWAEGVWTKGDNKDAAWKFVEYVSRPESLEKINKEVLKTRRFGLVSPRRDMDNLTINDPVLGAITQQAEDADSWFLVSRTFDGPTGINSQMTKFFREAVDKTNKNKGSVGNSLDQTADKVFELLVLFGLARK